MITAYPADELELQELIRSRPKLQIVGNETKSALVQPVADASRISLIKLNQILDHLPSEFLVTSQAGVKIADLAKTLASHGQYLPFDPPLSIAGATVGGTVAAGLSGPARLRHGGLRDFIVGIRFVDGLGKSVVGGGKVVKNSAGYDFPKLLVGSCGNLGAITEVTFKVFPKPLTSRTIRIECRSLAQASQLQSTLAKLPIEWSAIDLIAPVQLVVRYEGSEDYLATATARVTQQTAAIDSGLSVEVVEDETLYWQPFQDGSLATKNGWLVRIPLIPSLLIELDRAVEPLALTRRYSVAGNLAWLTIANDTQFIALNDCLAKFKLGGTALLDPRDGSRGALPLSQVHLGMRPSPSMLTRVKSALDPEERFVCPA